MQKTTRIDQTVLIGATPEAVYQALVNAEKHAEFTGAEATGEERVGGDFTAWDGYIEGRHLELEPGRRIVQEWKTSEWPDGYPPSHLEFVLNPKGSATELTMHHSKVPSEQAESYRQGWTDFYWTPLQAYFSPPA